MTSKEILDSLREGSRGQRALDKKAVTPQKTTPKKGKTPKSPFDMASSKAQIKSRVKRINKRHESFIGHNLSDIIEGKFSTGRFDAGGQEKEKHKRAFDVGRDMAEREFKDPKTAKINKARREKLKKAGHKSVSAGMADQSKKLRGEK